MNATSLDGLGEFYLGRDTDAATGEANGPPVLLDSSDLTTHGVIVGMTGSGKTGLGVSLIEEAALDGIPVIAIDPKGDLANLKLTFPRLAPDDFAPWIDPAAAAAGGRSVEEEAEVVATRWRDGLAAWSQGPERIEALRSRAQVRLYTPGSTAVRPLSVLGQLEPPRTVEDEAGRERVEATVSSILALVGEDAEPVQDPAHVFLSRVVSDAWRAGHSIELAAMIEALLVPPFERLGVMTVDTFFPERDRVALATRLNALLAAPSFAAWTEGEPLHIPTLLAAPDGRPRVSVLSIAHLGDDERMFFVTRLLTELVSWMRTQPGTGSLRALIYFDEVMGYLPPVSNPASKRLILTLLKQARAFGIGLVLSTQNPVDLDYKALSNCGTWCVGRLQTEQDKARLVDGLTSAAATGLSPADVDARLSSLGKRVFLLHSVHDDRPPRPFHTRWAMSYLAGPLTRDQMRSLVATDEPDEEATTASSIRAPRTEISRANTSTEYAAGTQPPTSSGGYADKPRLPRGIEEVVLPAQATGATYVPMLYVELDARYARASVNIDHVERYALVAPVDGDPVWDRAQVLNPPPSSAAPVAESRFEPVPDLLRDSDELGRHETPIKRWFKQNVPMIVYENDRYDAASEPGETERAFRTRLGLIAREQRDEQKTEMRERYQAKIDQLEKRAATAQDAVDRERAQAEQRKLDTFVSIGTSLLAAFTGGSRRSMASKAGTVARSYSRQRRESSDIDRAEEKLGRVVDELQDLEAELEAELARLDRDVRPEELDLTQVTIRANQTDMVFHRVGVAWVPREDAVAG